MTSRSRRHSSLAFACSLALASLIVPGAASADPDPSAGCGAAGLRAPDEAVANLEEHARAAGALGIYVDETTGEYVVVGWSGSRSDLAAANLERDGVPIRIETRDIVRSDVDAIAARLVAMRSESSLDGESYRFGIDPELGKVILVSTAPESVFADVLGAFSRLVVFRHGGPLARFSRSDDAEPHWGGAEISNWEGGCTSGYTVRKTSNGVNYMVSAGHCASLSDAITQPDTGLSYGTVSFKADFPATDSLLIGSETFAGRIYIGDEAGTAKPVWGAGNPALNATYCFSGSESNETCGHVATDTDETVCFSDGCTDHLVVFTGGATGGDSGGPIFIKYGTTSVYIRGNIVGGLVTELKRTAIAGRR